MRGLLTGLAFWKGESFKMINSPEKLEKFKQAVSDEARQRAEEILNETRAECEDRLKTARSETMRLTAESKDRIDEEYRTASVREISSESLSSRRNILLKREEMIERVFENVRARLGEYRKTPDYEKLLIKRAEECAKARPGKKGILLLSPADMGFKYKLTAGGQFTVKSSPAIELGGITVIYEDENLALDCTFDSDLAAGREGFAARAGLTI